MNVENFESKRPVDAVGQNDADLNRQGGLERLGLGWLTEQPRRQVAKRRPSDSPAISVDIVADRQVAPVRQPAVAPLQCIVGGQRVATAVRPNANRDRFGFDHGVGFELETDRREPASIGHDLAGKDHAARPRPGLEGSRRATTHHAIVHDHPQRPIAGVDRRTPAEHVARCCRRFRGAQGQFRGRRRLCRRDRCCNRRRSDRVVCARSVGAGRHDQHREDPHDSTEWVLAEPDSHPVDGSCRILAPVTSIARSLLAQARDTARDKGRVARDKGRAIADRTPVLADAVGRSESIEAAATARLAQILNGPDKNHRYDLQTHVIIERVLGPGDLAIDVGCHEGAILDSMIAAAPGSTHIAFEPLPHLFDALVEKYDGTELHRMALVAEPVGDLEFHHVVTNPGYSGLKERRYDRPDETVELISVPTAKLDDIVGDRSPALIKVDVEGAELGVLQGGRATIVRCQPIVVFEHGLGGSDIYGTDPTDIAAFFAEADMGVSLLGTWLEDGPPLSTEQFSEQFHEGHNYYFIAHPLR